MEWLKDLISLLQEFDKQDINFLDYNNADTLFGTWIVVSWIFIISSIALKFLFQRFSYNIALRATLLKYIYRFSGQLIVFFTIFLLLCPLKISSAKNQEYGLIMLDAVYHALRFFVIEGDMDNTLKVLKDAMTENQLSDWVSIAYRIMLYSGFFVAPFFTITAIISVFRNIRARFQYFMSVGEIHVFSELNEKSFALADSILKERKNKKRELKRLKKFYGARDLPLSVNHLKKNLGPLSSPVIVFTDVLEPVSEKEYDLQESAEIRGAICFRNDLEDIRYRVLLFFMRRKINFYLINEDETEKVRHASFIFKRYNRKNISLYIFSDKMPSKFVLTSNDNIRMNKLVRINDAQALVYHNLHMNGMRLFETAKRLHIDHHVTGVGNESSPVIPEIKRDDGAEAIMANYPLTIKEDEVEPYPMTDTSSTERSVERTPVTNKALINTTDSIIAHEDEDIDVHAESMTKTSDVLKPIRITAVLVGFGRYGTEMFKALLWYCQVPGYEIEIHVIDNKPNLLSRLNADYPDLMKKNYYDLNYDQVRNIQINPKSATQKGDARYAIVATNQGIDVNSKEFEDQLAAIHNPTYVFVALGSDDENIRISLRIRELYRRIGKGPDIETVVFDSKLTSEMSYRWAQGGCLDAAVRLYTKDHAYYLTYAKEYKELYEAVESQLMEDVTNLKEKLNRLKNCPLCFTHSVNVARLYDRNLFDQYYGSADKTEKGKYVKEILKFTQVAIAKTKDIGCVNIKHHANYAVIKEENDIVTIQVVIATKPYVADGEDENTVYLKMIKDLIESAYRDALVAIHARGTGAKNFKEQPYRVHMIGDLDNFYTKDTIINSELREMSEKINARWMQVMRKNAERDAKFYNLYYTLSDGKCELKPEFSNPIKPEELPAEYQSGRFVSFFTAETLDKCTKIRIAPHALVLLDNGPKKKVPYIFKRDGADIKKVTNRDFIEDVILLLFNHLSEQVTPKYREYRNLNESQKEKKYQVRPNPIDRYIEVLEMFSEKELKLLLQEDLPEYIYTFYSKDRSILWTENELKEKTEYIVLAYERETQNLRDLSFYTRCNAGHCPMLGLPGDKWPNCCRKCAIEMDHARKRCLCSTEEKTSKWQRIKEYLLDRYSYIRVYAITSAIKEPRFIQCNGCASCKKPCLSYRIYASVKKANEKKKNIQDEFKYEYNQRSSMAKYIHICLRFRLLRSGFLDDEIARSLNDPRFFLFHDLLYENHVFKPERFGMLLTQGVQENYLNLDPVQGGLLKTIRSVFSKHDESEVFREVDQNVNLAIGVIEHIRWTAYMRTEGYSYYFERDDLAKRHNKLLPVSYLSLEDLRKDV